MHFPILVCHPACPVCDGPTADDCTGECATGYYQNGGFGPCISKYQTPPSSSPRLESQRKTTQLLYLDLS